MSLPFFVRNRTQVDHKIGSVWFKPGAEKKINKSFYESHRKLIRSSIDQGILEVIDYGGGDIGEPVASQEVVAAPPIEVVENDNDDVVEENEGEDEVEVGDERAASDEDEPKGSIIDRFVTGELHWTHVVKEINETDDVNILENYIIDAKFHGLPESGVVLKTLNERIIALNGN